MTKQPDYNEINPLYDGLELTRTRKFFRKPCRSLSSVSLAGFSRILAGVNKKDLHPNVKEGFTCLVQEDAPIGCNSSIAWLGPSLRTAQIVDEEDVFAHHLHQLTR